MPLAEEQRRALGAFIRARREALSPSLPGPRRRTFGLRREEVAQDSGISITWYTWIEQGRDISVSAAALARLSATLRLLPAERAYLFELARTRDPAPPAEDMAAPAELLTAVEAVTSPCYLLDRLWRACGWNKPAARLFSLWLEGAEPNLLRFVFLDPLARDFIIGWEDRARRLLAEFRADTAAHDDTALQELIAGLCRDSPFFARLWTSQAVLSREGGERRFMHPRDGAVAFEQLTLIRAGHPGHKLVMHLPSQPTAMPPR